jgi:ligand-binding sensor domain-containing protein/class 3 adenylate cyclase
MLPDTLKALQRILQGFFINFDHVKHMKKAILLLTGFIFSAALSAQPAQIRFDNIDINDGLSQSLVNDIIQDEKGFIWIATQDGLNKYDGKRFVVFKKSPSEKNSLSNNFVHCIYEDKEGYLWIGTNGGGINKFNKRTEKFEHISAGDQNRIVTDIIEDRQGFIWFATMGGGLNRYDKKTGRIISYIVKGIDAKNVQTLFIDKSGTLFAGSSGKGLFIYQRQDDRFEGVSGNIDEVVSSITQDKSGRIWVGTNNGLLCIDGNFGRNRVGVKEFVNNPSTRYSIPNNTVKSVYITSTGYLIVCTTGSGIAMANLARYPELKFVNYNQNDFIDHSLADNLAQCALEDKAGVIWIGTNNGLSRFDPLKQVFSQITMEIDNPNSLNDKNVWSIFEDRHGILWIGTREGLNRVDRKNNQVYRYNRIANNRNSLNNNSVLSIYVDNDDNVWVGAVDGLFRLELSADYRSARFVPVPFRRGSNEFSDNRIYHIREDKNGFLWIGSREGLSYVNKKTGEFAFFQNNPNDKTSLPSNNTRFTLEDSRGDVWVSCDGFGIAKIIFSKGNDKNSKYGDLKFRSYHTVLKENPDEDILVTSIHEEEGKLWLGTYGNGLICFDPVTEKVIKRYSENDGLPNNAIYGIVGDKKNHLWMSTNYGLSRYDLKTNKFQNYLEKDGLQSNEFNVGAFHISKSGELFFGGINGFNFFYPEDLRVNTVAPEVVITDLMLFNKPLRIGDKEKIKQHPTYTENVTFSYRENSLTIRFAALHFSNPTNNRFRYIMEGLEDEEVEAGTSGEAHYNKIPYGTYTFKVRASNSDGVWSDHPATLVITINPPFWHTWWFRALAVLLILGGFFGFNQARIYNIKKQRLQLAREVRERTREVMEQKEKIEDQKRVIEEEKNKVEKLLLNILPEETAEELKSKGKASARSYRQVTVMFTDFVGFTKIAEKMRPAELVAKLDSYFITFDEIIQKYNLEKIKTIGDSYMCAGGVPIRSKSNPIDTVLAALDIQRYMKELKDKALATDDEPWDLRLGINTGEIIAGVIGTKRFAYDIWGNTVNTANRLQITSEPSMVNISGSTYAEIEPYFECTYRGKIAAKNKGEIDMYYVHQIKPELSVDGLGIEPNEKFWKYVDLYLYSSINYKKAERYIMKILRDQLPSHLYYHGIHHTHDVVNAAERIALMEGITDEQMFILKSAATYHDAGFVEQYNKNEPVGIRMAQDILPRYGYTPEQVDEVAKLINATIIPHNPNTQLEEIICDADLDYLGRDDFHQIADTLRRELREQGIINSDRGWDEMQVKFLTMHKYFTQSAIKLRQKKKEKHLEEIKQRLAENNYKD